MEGIWYVGNFIIKIVLLFFKIVLVSIVLIKNVIIIFKIYRFNIIKDWFFLKKIFMNNVYIGSLVEYDMNGVINIVVKCFFLFLILCVVIIFGIL